MGKEAIQHAACRTNRTETMPINMDVFTAEQRANHQLIYMDSFTFDGADYLPTLGDRQHTLGSMPALASDRFQRGRGLIYVSYHGPEEVLFRFGDKAVRPDSGFWAISFCTPVQNDNSVIERFVMRTDCLTQVQAVKTVKELISCDGAQAVDEGNGIYSVDKNFDPFGKKNYLIEALKKVIGANNLSKEQKKLIDTLRRQSEVRLWTHNPNKDRFQLQLVFVPETGKYVVFDHVLNRYVLWEETTSDRKSLSFIGEAQSLTAAYRQDKNPGKAPLQVSFAVALSARTAGLRNEPSGVESGITFDPATNTAVQNSTVRPLGGINPGLFDKAVSNWQPDTLATLSFPPPPVTRSEFPIWRSGEYGGGFSKPPTLRFGEKPATEPIMNDIATVTADTGAVLTLVYLAPAVFDAALITLANTATVTADFAISPSVASAEPPAIPATGVVVADKDKKIASFSIPEVISTDFPPEPDLDPSGSDGANDTKPPDGGRGGRALPKQFEVAWNKKMETRFQEAQGNKPENVIFEEKPNDGAVKEVVKFREYATTIEVVPQEKRDAIVVEVPIVEEETTPLLITGTTNIREFPKIERQTCYETTEYHSEKSKHSRQETRDTKSQKDKKKKVISSTLLTGYLRWRELVKLAQTDGLITLDAQGKDVYVKDNDGHQEKDDKFLDRVEKNKTNPLKLKLRSKSFSPNPAFISLLFLIKLKLQVQKTTSLAGLKKLFLTDTLLLFLLKSSFFLAPTRLVAQATPSWYNESTYEHAAQTGQ